MKDKGKKKKKGKGWKVLKGLGDFYASSELIPIY